MIYLRLLGGRKGERERRQRERRTPFKLSALPGHGKEALLLRVALEARAHAGGKIVFSIDWGPFCVTRALVFAAYTRAPDFLETPRLPGCETTMNFASSLSRTSIEVLPIGSNVAFIWAVHLNP